MKNRLLFPIIFAFIFSACSDFTGNEDAVEASLKPGPDTTAPILKEVTAVTTPTTDTTPNYTFSSSEAGTITYGGSCSSSNKNAISGNNTITLRTLSNGTYSDCTITVKNTLGNSATLIISTFVVDSPTQRIYYDLYGITFGDNTFVAVGKTGAIRTSSDNGSSWDNGTSGTTYYFNEVAYGDSTFIAVGQSGKIITSSDNGSSWDNSTQAITTAQLTGVAFGDDVGIAVASTDILRSRNDNGSNWVQSNSMDDVYDVVFGNRTASGEVATVDTITDNGSHDNGTYTSVALSGGSGSGAKATVILSGDNGSSNVTSVSITDGGNGLYQIGDVLTIDNATIGGDDNATIRVATVTVTNATCRVATVTVTSKVFVGVGDDGKVCYSTNYKDNTETWSCPQEIVDDKQLYGITYGNNKFIAVGESGTVVRSDNGSVWDISTSNTTGTLYSVAFGNSRFVGVGYNTVIVSTDNGTSFTRTETSYDFNDISYGNGLFVAVGDDENIHTSTDGDTWTKVYGK